jgi:hypothetical protein
MMPSHFRVLNFLLIVSLLPGKIATPASANPDGLGAPE